MHRWRSDQQQMEHDDARLAPDGGWVSGSGNGNSQPERSHAFSGRGVGLPVTLCAVVLRCVVGAPPAGGEATATSACRKPGPTDAWRHRPDPALDLSPSLPNTPKHASTAMYATACAGLYRSRIRSD